MPGATPRLDMASGRRTLPTRGDRECSSWTEQCEPSVCESALTLTTRLNQCQWLMNAVLPVHCRPVGDSTSNSSKVQGFRRRQGQSLFRPSDDQRVAAGWRYRWRRGAGRTTVSFPLQTPPVRHRPRTGRPLRPRRQQRLDQPPQLVIDLPTAHSCRTERSPTSRVSLIGIDLADRVRSLYRRVPKPKEIRRAPPPWAAARRISLPRSRERQRSQQCRIQWRLQQLCPRHPGDYGRWMRSTSHAERASRLC